ncbi:hypothetical protein AU577_15690 [Salmonella enterica subsp. enterica serovar Alachua]|nr:hypothetical protein [Salmonella enterica subsp. enterica serovar Alachua]
MKTTLIVMIAATSLCALSACSHYMEATGPNGTTVKHVAIAPGTSITTPNGCIDTAGETCAPYNDLNTLKSD